MGTEIVLVIGGARSGKSSFVVRETETIRGRKAFIATAEALDDEMKERIERHKTERGNDWDTVEEAVDLGMALSDLKGTCRVIVIDCLTLWLSNVLVRAEEAEEGILRVKKNITEFVDRLHDLKKGAGNPGLKTSLFIVSNEVGMGIVPENRLARQFRDLAGMLNQKVAEIADEVYLVTAGIPLKIKDQKPTLSGI